MFVAFAPAGTSRALLDGCEWFRQGPVRACRAKENCYWHLSISCECRYPTWDEIADARYQLLPNDVYVAMFLPPPRDYVNYADVFHTMIK